MARLRAPPSFSSSTRPSGEPATKGDRVRMTTPVTSRASARTSRLIHNAPPRKMSPKRVMPSTMLTSGLVVTRVVRDAVMGPACERALKQKDSSNADDRKHVWLEVAEDSAPAVVQVGRNRLGQS